MKKIFLTILMTTMLMSASIPAFADETDNVNVTFNTPKITMYDDLNGNYDIMSTLRMTFPDVCFQENIGLINDILGDKRQTISDGNAKDLGTLFSTRLYLLPLQLKAYDYEMYKIGMTNPYFGSLLDSINNKPTVGKQDLIQMQLANYMQLGFMKSVD